MKKNKLFNENIEAAISGDAKAQYIIGWCYFEGAGVKKNLKKALKWLSKASDQNYPNALYTMGNFYETGFKGIEKNFVTALEYYKKSANLNYPEAQNEMGLVCVRQEDFDNALNWFYKAAEQNLADSMTNIAIILINGYGEIEIDLNMAISYLNKAVELKNSTAMYILATLYMDGKGVEKDTKKALKLFKMSADLDNIHAKSYLGNIYENGELVKKDIEKALKYWSESAEFSEYALSKIKEYAQKNYASAQYYYYKFLYSEDKEEAHKWLMLSADNGFAEAQYDIGIYYRDGIGLGKDLDKAEFYLKKAVKQKYPGSYYALIEIENKPEKNYVDEQYEHFISSFPEKVNNLTNLENLLELQRLRQHKTYKQSDELHIKHCKQQLNDIWENIWER